MKDSLNVEKIINVIGFIFNLMRIRKLVLVWSLVDSSAYKTLHLDGCYYLEN